MSQRGDGGELVITSGGGTDGMRFPTPRFAFSGQIPPNGTAEARLLWVENSCELMLDCSSCPPQLRISFNASVLDGALLLCDVNNDARLDLCGYNQMARALGRTGLVAIAACREPAVRPLDAAGYIRMSHRRGELRDAHPHHGDGGIPFPFVQFTQYAFNPVLQALNKGVHMRAVLTPTCGNPWQSTMCGYWKPLSTILMLGHVWVAERAASCFIGHAQSAGIRFDLAQATSLTEMTAHLLCALNRHDPFFSFHWGTLPAGVFIATLVTPLMLMCSSTLLLAGFWCVSHLSQRCSPNVQSQCRCSLGPR